MPISTSFLSTISHSPFTLFLVFCHHVDGFTTAEVKVVRRQEEAFPGQRRLTTLAHTHWPSGREKCSVTHSGCHPHVPIPSCPPSPSPHHSEKG